jgi:hypothetical protein
VQRNGQQFPTSIILLRCRYDPFSRHEPKLHPPSLIKYYDRPQQALNMKYPGEIYSLSPRPYQGLSEVEYPFHDRTVIITGCGRIRIWKRKINLSWVFTGQAVGITEITEKIWRVSLMHYDWGIFDHESFVKSQI